MSKSESYSVHRLNYQGIVLRTTSLVSEFSRGLDQGCRIVTFCFLPAVVAVDEVTGESEMSLGVSILSSTF